MRIADPVGLEGDLTARAERLDHAVELRDVAEPGRDQQRTIDRVPVDRARGATLAVGAGRLGERHRDGWGAVGGDRGGLGNLRIAGRGGGADQGRGGG